MSKIITVTANKGGRHVTTTAINLAHSLARTGAAVKLLDLDYGQASQRLGFDGSTSAHHALLGLSYEVIPALPNLGLISGNFQLFKLEKLTEIEPVIDRIDEIASTCDYLVIDTPPGGLLRKVAVQIANTLVASVVVASPDCIEDVDAIIALARPHQPEQHIIVPSGYDYRLGEHVSSVAKLDTRFEGCVLPPVPARIEVAEAAAHGMTVFNYENRCLYPVRDAFDMLGEWIVSLPEMALFGEL